MYGFCMPLANMNLSISSWDRGDGVPNGCISSPFRSKERPTHKGIDVAYYISSSGAKLKNTGNPIYAAQAGTVTERGYDSSRGYYAGIEHSITEKVTTRYYHMQEYASVQLGSAVVKGQPIGRVGSTGNSTGPHLHFEIQPTGKDWINPVLALAGAEPISGFPATTGSKEECPYKEPTSAVRNGHTGENAKWVQWQLNRKGASPKLTVDGGFGLLTAEAVKGFQSRSGIRPADGIVGQLTRYALACPYNEPSATLKKGSKGEEVKWLQWYLNKKSFTLTVDGDFGSATDTAVRAIQAKYVITVDGLVGAGTRDKLKNYY